MGLIRKRAGAPSEAAGRGPGAEPDPTARQVTAPSTTVTPLTDDGRLVLSYTLDPETMLPRE